MNPPTAHKRVTSIDVLRGLVMVIMALDHVRDYFHYDAFFFDPTDLSQTTPALFFTRFVTHFCAPIFVFLAGTSAYFVGKKKSKHELSLWLVKRGFWLIFAELIIVKFGWMFKLNFEELDLQVIWVLGAAMIFLAGIIHLPKKVTIICCIVFIAIHNAFDGYQPESGLWADIWIFLHQSFRVVPFGSVNALVAYPLIPWIFLMPLGYHFGALYAPEYGASKRQRFLWIVGGIIIFLFVTIRLLNVYGDPHPWSTQKNFTFTILSFLNLAKYPPSLLYLLITIGPTFIFLAIAEKWETKLHGILSTIGRVPMFYYIVHIFLIHLLALIAASMTGFKASDMILDTWVTMSSNLQGYGFGLGVVYLVWIFVVVSLYPVCKWYGQYKAAHRHYWWLSYL